MVKRTASLVARMPSFFFADFLQDLLLFCSTLRGG